MRGTPPCTRARAPDAQGRAGHATASAPKALIDSVGPEARAASLVIVQVACIEVGRPANVGPTARALFSYNVLVQVACIEAGRTTQRDHDPTTLHAKVTISRERSSGAMEEGSKFENASACVVCLVLVQVAVDEVS